jgi:hypothetical protein
VGTPRSTALLLAALAAGCVSDIRAGDGAALVITYQAPALDLAGRTTFLLPTVAGRAGLSGGALTTAAPALLAAVSRHLEARGFQEAAAVDPLQPPATPPAADLLVNVTVLETEVTDAAAWVTLDGHLPPDAFGFPGLAWAWPWSWLAVGTPPGSVLVELADVTALPAPPGACPVVWAAVLIPAAGDVPGPDAAATLASLDRAFTQSPAVAAGVSP